MYGYGYAIPLGVAGGGVSLPVNTVAPAITGTAEVGQTLTCSTGTWSGSPTYAYQWKRGGVNIGGATSSTYTLVAADEGESIKCTVTATNGGGSATADSNTVTPTWEADAQAFITAASITDPTQQEAVNQLVIDLKAASLWTKMKAVYPMVGGTSTSMKWNLKDPRDLDAAYRLSFAGGWMFSQNGAAPNGTNALASTFWQMDDIALATRVNNYHMSYYSRTQVPTGNGWVMGRGDTVTGNPLYGIALKRTPSNARIWDSANSSNNGRVSDTITDARGFYCGTRVSTTSAKLYKDGNTALNNTATVSHNTGFVGYGVALGAMNGYDIYYQSNECAFASFGDGLSDTEAANLYTAVQTFQTTLGRSIGTQTVSDSDAQAFVTAASITDQVEAEAVNQLVIDLKAASIWTKMKAVYPMVGGTSTSMKWNLKDPRDLDAAFRLSFAGGWTHSANGALPNGSNAYADTHLILSTALSGTAPHQSYYSRTNGNTGGDQIDMGVSSTSNRFSWLSAWYNASGYSNVLGRNTSLAILLDGGVTTDSRGLYQINKVGTTSKLQRNSSILDTETDTETNPTTYAIYIGASNQSGTAGLYTNRQCSFASIGDGLTDTEATNLYTAVQTFQTSLSRNV